MGWSGFRESQHGGGEQVVELALGAAQPLFQNSPALGAALVERVDLGVQTFIKMSQVA